MHTTVDGLDVPGHWRCYSTYAHACEQAFEEAIEPLCPSTPIALDLSDIVLERELGCGGQHGLTRRAFGRTAGNETEDRHFSA